MYVSMSAAKQIKRINLWQPLRCSTWNVLTLDPDDSIPLLMLEVQKHRVDLAGLQETRFQCHQYRHWPCRTKWNPWPVIVWNIFQNSLISHLIFQTQQLIWFVATLLHVCIKHCILNALPVQYIYIMSQTIQIIYKYSAVSHWYTSML